MFQEESVRWTRDFTICHRFLSLTIDVSRYSWQDMCPLRFPRCFANLADCLGGLYIVGGAWLDSGMDCGNFSSVFDVDKFNDRSNVWEGVTALRVGRHDCGCAVLGRLQGV